MVIPIVGLGSCAVMMCRSLLLLYSCITPAWWVHRWIIHHHMPECRSISRSAFAALTPLRSLALAGWLALALARARWLAGWLTRASTPTESCWQACSPDPPAQDPSPDQGRQHRPQHPEGPRRDRAPGAWRGTWRSTLWSVPRPP